MRSKVAAERAFRRRCRARHSASSLLLPTRPEPSCCHTRPPSTDRLAPLQAFHLDFSGCIRLTPRPAASCRPDRCPSPDGAGRDRDDGVGALRMEVLSGEVVGGRRGPISPTPGRHPETSSIANCNWSLQAALRRTTHPMRGLTDSDSLADKGKPDAIQRTRGGGLGRPPIEDRVSGGPLHTSRTGADPEFRPVRDPFGSQVSAIRPTRSVAGERPGPSWPARFDP
jgi:hypothetical protein